MGFISRFFRSGAKCTVCGKKVQRLARGYIARDERENYTPPKKG